MDRIAAWIRDFERFRPPPALVGIHRSFAMGQNAKTESCSRQQAGGRAGRLTGVSPVYERGRFSNGTSDARHYDGVASTGPKATGRGLWSRRARLLPQSRARSSCGRPLIQLSPNPETGGGRSRAADGFGFSRWNLLGYLFCLVFLLSAFFFLFAFALTPH